MTGKELKDLCDQFPDFEFEFRFTDDCSVFPNIRTFNSLELCDIGHSDKVVVITGEEH